MGYQTVVIWIGVVVIVTFAITVAVFGGGVSSISDVRQAMGV